MAKPTVSTGTEADTERVVLKPKAPTAAELLAMAAEALEQLDGPRAGKHYRLLANEVRTLAARI